MTTQPGDAAPRPHFYLAASALFEVAGRTFGGDLFRENDGSLIIMEAAADPDEPPRRALIVPRVARVKRSESYSALDPAQEAFAQRVLDLLNGGA